MTEPHDLPCALVLGARINALGWPETLAILEAWARSRESRYVCISNVHMVVTSQEDPALADAMQHADMATPDGAPIAWMLRKLGFPGQARISGTELMLAYMKRAAASQEPVFLFGSTQETLARLRDELRKQFPALQIAGAVSPPFRTLTDEEDQQIIGQINASGARTVWVSLGCPKQEKWMHAHRGQVNAVMLGVGAAFDFIASTKARAPRWMQQSGLEWLHRVLSEPRRLWLRYASTNSRFVIGAARQLWGRR